MPSSLLQSKRHSKEVGRSTTTLLTIVALELLAPNYGHNTLLTAGGGVEGAELTEACVGAAFFISSGAVGVLLARCRTRRREANQFHAYYYAVSYLRANYTYGHTEG